jgi:proteasome accessory factor A
MAAGPEALIGKVDWITKRWLFSRFVSRERIRWSDPWLRALDLEFHHVDPERSLGLGLEQTPPAWQVSRDEVAAALRQPPANTRAHVRARLMRLLKGQPVRYFVDWEVIDAEGLPALVLQDPFAAAPTEARAWEQQLRKPINNG